MEEPLDLCKILWIKEDSRNGEKIIDLLNRVLKWKETTGLKGAKRKYDFAVGSYGNPDADIVFMPIIPSLQGLDDIVEKIPWCRLWQMPWNWSDGDLLFRDELANNEFILSKNSNEPWKWGCWITNFVKVAEYDNVWDYMPAEQKNPILQQSSEFLREELEIIKPKLVVAVGKEAYENCMKYLKRLPYPIERIRHYSRVTNDEQKREFHDGMKRVKALYSTEGVTYQ